MLNIYLSHKISDGCKNDIKTQEENCKRAVAVGKCIEYNITKGKIDIYIPGGYSERFVGKAYRKGYMTVEQILEIDCDILAECDIVLCYIPEGDELNGGRKVEVKYAEKIGKPYFLFNTPEMAVNILIQYMTGH